MASRSWNRVELIGNLTRDPELRYTPNGAAVCTFGLATNRTYVSDGEKKEEVDFHRLVAWNKLAELCSQLLKKGMRTFISGRLQTRSWEGQDGQSRQITEVVIEDMIILSPKSNGDMATVGSDIDADVTPVRPAPSPRVVAPVEEAAEESKESAPAKADEEKPATAKAPKEEVSDDDLPF